MFAVAPKTAQKAFLRRRGTPRAKHNETLKAEDDSREPKKRHGLSHIVKIAFNPLNLLVPIDHHMAFKSAVGAARGSVALKEHVTKLLETWIVIGTLILGVGVGLVALPKDALGAFPNELLEQLDQIAGGSPVMSLGNETNGGRRLTAERNGLDRVVSTLTIELIHWVFTLSNYVTCASSALGQILLGSVLVNCAGACSDDNFDLLLESARWVFMYNECASSATVTRHLLASRPSDRSMQMPRATYALLYALLEFSLISRAAAVLTCLMCWSLGFSLLLFPFVIQSSFTAGLALSGLFFVGFLFAALAINQVSALTLYGGLVSEHERASPHRPWDFRSRR